MSVAFLLIERIIALVGPVVYLRLQRLLSIAAFGGSLVAAAALFIVTLAVEWPIEPPAICQNVGCSMPKTRAFHWHVAKASRHIKQFLFVGLDDGCYNQNKIVIN